MRELDGSSRDSGTGSAWFPRPTSSSIADCYVFHDQYHLAPGRLPDRPVILDLGSNIGCTIVHYKYLYGGSRIIGVEMDEGNYELAKRNVMVGSINIEIHGDASLWVA